MCENTKLILNNSNTSTYDIIDSMRCLICGRFTSDEICSYCQNLYMYDKNHSCYRLKKSKLIHDNVRESRVRKVLGRIYGFSHIFEEVAFPWCVNPESGCLLRFDFLVVDGQYSFLVEFNGEQHYKFTRYFHNSRQDFTDQQCRDKVKKQLAEDAGYPLVIIPFNVAINENNIWKILRRALKKYQNRKRKPRRRR